MKNVAKIIPCYAADTSGVCSALYELGGLTVVHDASGCNSTYSTHDEPRWYDVRSNLYISALTELDAVMGNDEKLIADTVSAAHDRNPAFIAVCGSPMPMMTGVDFDAVAFEIQRRSGITTIPLHTNGTHSYIEGASEAFLEIVRAYVRECPKTGAGVAVLGATPLDLPLGTNADIRKWLHENGFETVSCLAMGSSLEEIDRTASARVSLVVSYSGMAAADYLYERFGIPYVVGVPIGGFGDPLADALREAARSGQPNLCPFVRGSGPSDDVIIGESIMALSLAAALSLDAGVNASVISPLPTDGRMLGDGDSDVYAEEDIEERLAALSPKRVWADPLYRYILPNQTALVAVPHFAFSGRCFDKQMKSPITRDYIKELMIS